MKNSLNFNKSAVVELNDSQMRGTDSGLTPLGFVILGIIAYEIYDDLNGTND